MIKAKVYNRKTHNLVRQYILQEKGLGGIAINPSEEYAVFEKLYY